MDNQQKTAGNGVSVMNLIVAGEGYVIRFRLDTTTRMGILMIDFSNIFGFPVASLDFLFNKKRIRSYDTPKELKLENYDVIKVYKRQITIEQNCCATLDDMMDNVSINSEPSDLKQTMNNQQKTKGDGVSEVEIIVVDVGEGHIFRLPLNATIQMGELMRDFSHRPGVPVASLDFLFNGKRIRNYDTPKELKLENYDVIKAYKRQITIEQNCCATLDDMMDNVSINSEQSDLKQTMNNQQKTEGDGVSEVEIIVVDVGEGYIFFPPLNATIQMEELMRDFSHGPGVPDAPLDFLFNGKRIRNYDTLKELKIDNYYVIKVYKRKLTIEQDRCGALDDMLDNPSVNSKPRDLKKQALSKRHLPVRDPDKYKLIIRVVYEDEDFPKEVHFRMKGNKKLEKVKRIFSDRVGVPVTSLHFLFHKRQVKDDETPKLLKMKHNDVIYVYRIFPPTKAGVHSYK